MRSCSLSLAIALALLVGIAIASPASAELETLDSKNAREIVAQSKGVVVVDLYAEW